MNGVRTRVVTGGTGFVGSHFVLRWLGDDGPIRALVRAASPMQAYDRLGRALARAAGIDGALGAMELRRWDCDALPADLLQAQCGLTDSALARLAQSPVHEFWHFAASLKYEARHREAIFESNVEGTRRALELAQRIGSDWFVHVSTAYTAGRMRGNVPEALHGMQVGFNNCYEESKAFAEREVASFCEAHRMRYAILRPSIVVGPFSTKNTGGSSSGLYGFTREILRVSGLLRSLGRPIEVSGEPETPCNLMPVDWFVDDVSRLLDEGLSNGGVYHHTCDHALTIREVGVAMARVLDLPGFTIRPEPSIARSPLETLIESRTGFYSGYFANGKRFERSRPFAPRIDLADLVEYLAAFVAEQRSGQPVRNEPRSPADVGIP